MKKKYESRSQKIFDFLIGAIALPAAFTLLFFAASATLSVHPGMLALTAISLWFGVSIYLGIQRAYVGIGFAAFVGLVVVVFPVILLGTCFLMMGVR